MSQPLTRVSLVFIPDRVNVWLRFGQPVGKRYLDEDRSIADFMPGEIFCRVDWRSGRYGTTSWQLLILQTCSPDESVLQIAGIQPGAELLLRASGQPRVLQLLNYLDDIEQRAVDLSRVPATFWRLAHHQMQARLPLPEYTAARHQAAVRVVGLR